MKKYRPSIILIALLVLLSVIGYNTYKKEVLLKEGTLILLKLAPVDPRSLIQGDYMQLRYEIAANIVPDSIPNRGYYVIHLDSLGVGNRVRIQKNKDHIPLEEYIIKYYGGSHQIKIGAESYLFQEGHAERYDEAKYGGLRVDEDGNSLLVGLYNGERNEL